MYIHGRKVALKTLSGSVNRNLNDQNSDKDIKAFVIPTFEDLYSSQVYKNFTTSDTEDIEIHDIRKLEKLLYNSNLTYLELLYSIEIDTFGHKEIEYLLSLRDVIAKMNLKSLFNSCFGMYKGQMRDLEKPNSELQKEMIKKYGYNTKKAMMSLHFLKFIVRFYKSDFNDFKSSIWYQGEDRDFMLAIKNGELTFSQFNKIIDSVEKQVKSLEKMYFEHPVNEEVNSQLKSLLRVFVKNNLKLT